MHGRRTAAPRPGWLSWSAASPPSAWRLHAHEDLRRQRQRPRAQLAARRRRGSDPRPSRHPDRRCPARQAQAGLHAARRHGRLRRRDQRGEDLRHGPEAPGEDVLPPLGLSGRPEVAHAQRHARAPTRGGHPPRRQGHAAQEPPRAEAADQAQGLRGPRSPARRAAAEAARARDQVGSKLMAEDKQGEEVNTQPPSSAGTGEPDELAAEDAVGAQEQPTERQLDREQAIADEPVAESEQRAVEATAPAGPEAAAADTQPTSSAGPSETAEAEP